MWVLDSLEPAQYSVLMLYPTIYIFGKNKEKNITFFSHLKINLFKYEKLQYITKADYLDYYKGGLS